MSTFYSDSHRALQDAFDTRKLADVNEKKVMRSALAATDKTFIAASDFFFLSTVDHNGFPTVSYKGGPPGFVSILDDRTLAFPAYHGNGMFYSMGNIADCGKIGMLFVDFERPRRLRLHGTATASREDRLMDSYPEALMIVRVALETVLPNCSRYVKQYRRIEASDSVPTGGGETPIS